MLAARAFRGVAARTIARPAVARPAAARRPMSYASFYDTYLKSNASMACGGCTALQTTNFGGHSYCVSAQKLGGRESSDEWRRFVDRLLAGR